MDTFYQSTDWTSAAFKTTSINAEVRQHLMKTYNALALMLLCASAGAYFAAAMAGTLTTLALFASLILFTMTPATPENYSKRLATLLSFGFLKGACIGPLLHIVAVAIDPSIVFNAFLGTVCIFACFSLAAMFSERRSLLYLGGILGSGLSLLMWLSIFSLFLGGGLMTFNIHLYLGLMIFCGFVAFDTQVIIEKVYAGRKDELGDALSLFIDFVAIFVRLVIILAKLQGGNRRERSKNRR